MHGKGRALVVVDVQNDFCPGGSLAVEGGDAVAAAVTAHLAASRYDLVVATTDWHPAGAVDEAFPHVATVRDFVSTWPVRCVQGTAGAEFHPALVLPDDVVVVRVLLPLVAGVEAGTTARALAELRAAGVELVDRP